MSDEHHHGRRRTSTMSIRRRHHLRVLAALATVGLASFGFATSASARVTTPRSTASGHSTAPDPLLGLQFDAAPARGEVLSDLLEKPVACGEAAESGRLAARKLPGDHARH
jgi:hypothetical protein